MKIHFILKTKSTDPPAVCVFLFLNIRDSSQVYMGTFKQAGLDMAKHIQQRSRREVRRANKEICYANIWRLILLDVRHKLIRKTVKEGAFLQTIIRRLKIDWGVCVQYHAILSSSDTNGKTASHLCVTQPQSHRKKVTSSFPMVQFLQVSIKQTKKTSTMSDVWWIKKTKKTKKTAATGRMCEWFELHVCVHVQLRVKLGIRAGQRG